VPRLGRSFLETSVFEHSTGARLVDSLTSGPDFPETEPDKGLHLLHYCFRPPADD